MQNVAGIILAGGYSKRMGRDKALLSLPAAVQETFLTHLLTLLTPICNEVVLVVRDAEQAAAYASYLTPFMPTTRIVQDHTPALGPLMGLYSGLRAVQASHALVTAVDTPFLQPALLTFLLEQPRDEVLRIPLVDGRPQVLLAVYPRTLLPLIEERLQTGRRDPRALLTGPHVAYIESEQLRIVDPQLRSFINVNTPEDLALQG